MRGWYRRALAQSPAFSVRWAPVARKAVVVKRRRRPPPSSFVAARGPCAAGGAGAHPLGNFTVNHYAGIELAGDRVYVHVVLDLAEIPTFQMGDRVRAPGYAAALARELELRLDGARVALRPVSHLLGARTGAGGLPTLRFEAAVCSAAFAARGSSSPTGAIASRIGWREITLVARRRRPDPRGVRPGRESLERASRIPARAAALAARRPLRNVPARARRRVRARRLGSAAARRRPHTGGGFEALIDDGDLSAGAVLVALLVAAFWGAAHALTPGHGKALVAGYLVGARGRPRHAFLLGGTVTVTHTAGVFALGLVTLLLSRFVVPEQLYPWLTLVSGVLVVVVGVGVLRARLATRGRRAHDHAHDHDHAHPHEHAHPHDLEPAGPVRASGSPRASFRARLRSSCCSARSPSTAWRSGSR